MDIKLTSNPPTAKMYGDAIIYGPATYEVGDSFIKNMYEYARTKEIAEIKSNIKYLEEEIELIDTQIIKIRQNSPASIVIPHLLCQKEKFAKQIIELKLKI
jgi:hypothetical protein